MIYRIAADFVVVLHVAFVLFVVGGALLLIKWPRLAWLHVPCFLWGTWVELASLGCPLTPLEKWFRRLGDTAGYDTGFIEHYFLPVLYPTGMTRELQIILGVLVLAGNLGLYSWIFLARLKQNR